MAKKYDYIIIGGGLVGSLVSLVLSKHSKSVCLIEKYKYNNLTTDSYSPLSLTFNSVEFLKEKSLWDEKYFKSRNIHKLKIKLFNSFKNFYETSLIISQKKPKIIYSVTIIFILLSILLFQFIPKELAPSEDRGIFIVSVNAPEGSSIEYTNNMVQKVENVLEKFKIQNRIFPHYILICFYFSWLERQQFPY